jgi:hypothetical protein
MSDIEFIFWIGVSLFGILWAVGDEIHYEEKNNGK